ncbi:hypothetical protein KAI65_06510 [Candidatus Parcubacteria bacterium]|nr:hypothetical protein [Candidatus Parcubacteria bacterium]
MADNNKDDKKKKLEIKTAGEVVANMEIDASEPWFEGDKIFIKFYVLLSNKNKEPVSGALVEFSDEYPAPYYIETSNSEGIATFKYQKEAWIVFGKQKTIQARVKGTSIVKKRTAPLFPDFGNGRERRKRSRMINQRRKASILLGHHGKTVAIFLPAIILLLFLPQATSAIMGLATGAFVSYFLKGYTRKIINFLIFGALGFSFYNLSSPIMCFAAMFILVVGEFFYHLEEINYLPEYVGEGRAASVKWESWINFYPWMSILSLLLVLGVDIIYLTQKGINFFETEEIVMSVFEPGIVYTRDQILNSGNGISAAKSFWHTLAFHLKFFAFCLLTLIIHAFYSLPGEFWETLKSKKGEFSIAGLLGTVLSFKELSDVLTKVRGVK